MIEISPKTTFVVLGSITFFILFWWLKLLFLAIVLAYTIASGFNFTAYKLALLTRLNLKLARLLVFFLTASFLFGVSWLLSTSLVNESTSFVKNFPFLFEKFLGVLDNLGLHLNNPYIRGLLTNSAGQIFSSGSLLTFGILETFTFALVILALSYYFLTNHENFVETVVKVFPKQKHRLKLIENRVYRRLGLWVAVQFLLSVAIGFITFLGLSYFHIEYAITLSLFTAILNLIPIIGSAIASFPAIVVATLHDPILGLWVFLFYNILQTLKDNYVSLRLVNFVGYNPMLLLLAFIVSMNLFDFAGALISVPILVATGVVFEEIRRSLNENNTINKRLFVSFPVPGKYLESLFINKKEFKDNISWVKEENYHITIYFLGKTEEKNLEEIKTKLQKITEHYSGINFNFEEFILAPPGKEKTMLWAKFKENSSYNKLVKEIHEQIGEYSNQEKRVNRIPHITLAKFKTPEVTEKIDLKNFGINQENILLANVSLYESQPSDNGSNYLLIKKFSLDAN